MTKEILANFTVACLAVGLFCGFVAMIADHFERRRINRSAVARRRVIFQEDGKPLCRIDDATYFDELPSTRRS